MAATDDTPASPSAPTAAEQASTNRWLTERIALREANLHAEIKRLGPGDFRQLKSDAKKASVFGRKFRNFTADMQPSIMSDLETLNLTMFVSEAAQNAAQCVADAKIKPADIPAFVAVLSVVHQKYESFSAEFASQIGKIAQVPMEDILQEMKKKLDFTATVASLPRARTVLRCLCELWAAALLPDCQGWLLKGVLLPMVQTLEAAATNHHTTASVSLLHAVVRLAGPELTRGAWDGIQPVAGDDGGAAAHDARLRAVKTSVINCTPHSTDKEAVAATKLITAATDKAIEMSRRLRKMMEEQHKKVCEATELRGEQGNAEVVAKFTAVLTEVHKIIGWTDAVAAATGRSADVVGLPDLRRVVETGVADSQVVVTSRLRDFFTVVEVEHLNYYDDEEKQAFYEQLPDIESCIPTDQTLAPKVLGEDETEERTTLDYTGIDAIISRLPQCSSTRNADAFVLEFLGEAARYYREPGTGGLDQARAFFNNCRVRLNNELRYARTNAVEMLPFYSRIVATLAKPFPDVPDALVSKVMGDLIATVNGKVTNVKGKKRRAGRYLAELTKFRVCPPRVVLRVLQVLTDELDGENASVWAAVYESVGSFLLRGNATKKALEEAVAAFTKKRNATSNISTQVDDEIDMAMSTVKEAMKPRGQYSPIRAAPDPPLVRFLRHLLFRELTSGREMDGVLASVRRLPWLDRDAQAVLVPTLRAVHMIAWQRVHLLADVIADVSDMHGWVGPVIVDMVLESLRHDLEHPNHRLQQRRLMDVKFLAELFNYRVAKAGVILYAMGQIVFYFPLATDSPTDYTRLRAFAMLVDCTLEYLFPRSPKPSTTKRNKAKKKAAAAPSDELDAVRIGFKIVLVHFYRLVHTRAKPIPHDIDFRLSEMQRLIGQSEMGFSDAQQATCAFPKNLQKADEDISEHGLWASSKHRNSHLPAITGAFASFVAGSAVSVVNGRGAVPSVSPQDESRIRIRTQGAMLGRIYSVIKADGRSAELLPPMAMGTTATDDGCIGPRVKPMDAAGGSSSSDEEEDDDSSDDDDDDSGEDSGDSDSDAAEEVKEVVAAPSVNDDAEYRRAPMAATGPGRFTTGGSAWLMNARHDDLIRRAQGGAMSAEQLQEQIDFDNQMKASVKDAISDASSKRSGAGLQQIDRAVEQRLSGGNISSLAREAKVAPTARAMLDAHREVVSGPPPTATTAVAAAPAQASGAQPQPPTTFTKIALLRRGANDKTEARAILVPASDFTVKLKESHDAHAAEVAEARKHTLAINRAIGESSSATDSSAGRGRGGFAGRR